MFSGTLAGDVDPFQEARNSEIDIQWAYRLGYSRSEWKRVQTQVSVRYSNRYASIADNQTDLRSLTKAANAGHQSQFYVFLDENPMLAGARTEGR